MQKNKIKLIAPSILSADFSKLGEEIKDIQDAGADLIHIDVMDGHFVPNITMGTLIVKAIKKITNLNLDLDVHLMIENPDFYIESFIDAGASWISVHAEACRHLNRSINLIKDLGAKKNLKIKAGVALNPATSLNRLDWCLEYLDFVLIMSVNPGFGGQSFIQNSLEKIKNLSLIIEQKRLNTLIQVDGGVNKDTIQAVSQAGTNIFVAGSAIFGANDYKFQIDTLKSLMQF